MKKSTAPLTPAMTEAIKNTEPGDVMKGGPTRAALMRRGLVHDCFRDFGTLTEEGARLRENLLETQRRAERTEALKSEPAVDPLEPELPAVEAPGAAGDRYMSTGPGADVKARDAQVIPERVIFGQQPAGPLRKIGEITVPMELPQRADRAISGECGGALSGEIAYCGNSGPELAHVLLPQRVAGKALTEELTGEVFAPVSASADLKELGVTEGTPEAVSAVLGKHSGLAVASVVDAARPGARAQVQMRPVEGEILECKSRETMIAIGAEWGAWEGKRVRIGGMSDSIIQGRHLLIVLADRGEPDWVRDTDRTVPTPAALTIGCLVMVNGYPHRVEASWVGDAPMLVRVR